MRKNIYLYSAIVLLFLGCNKNPADKNNQLNKIDARKSAAVMTTSDPSDIMAFYNFIESPVNGVFGFKETKIINNNLPRQANTDPYAQFDGAFYDANNNIIPGGEITFGMLKFPPNPARNFFYDMSVATAVEPGRADYLKKFYSSVAGTTQSISIDPVYANKPLAKSATVNSSRTVSGSLYFPKQIGLKLDNMTSKQDANAYYFWMPGLGGQMGFDIYWTADPANDKGVVIILEYDDDLQRSTTLVPDPGTPAENRKHYRGIRVPDNGYYRLTRSDVEKVLPPAAPTKHPAALVIVTVGRANYTTLSSADGLEKYAVYAGTSADILLRYYDSYIIIEPK
ncbi:hypothetical protein HGH93_05345 [Chitinophaga polysaccharea]|uniref:hypothetical protein n=1 Tax=Chitinophaga TaxID=79328 RepID=UPI001455C8E1|nr:MULTISPECIES: hypothetical protein [Chitinophaga]NLR57511.1 hypothetical protein [Chitinophaga polysaccharea]NLU95425.1 hypothetical protein [Chitinophaga sp. Ak27]